MHYDLDNEQVKAMAMPQAINTCTKSTPIMVLLKMTAKCVKWRECENT